MKQIIYKLLTVPLAILAFVVWIAIGYYEIIKHYLKR